MRDNKALLIQTARRALGYPAHRRRQAPPGLFPEGPSQTSLDRLKRIKARRPAERQALIDRLFKAAEPIQLDVCLVPSAKEAAAAIVKKVASFPTEWGDTRQVCAWNHPLIDSLALSSKLTQQGIHWVSGHTYIPRFTDVVSSKTRAALRRAVSESFVGITAADFCVADTATLVLRTGPGCPRSVSLVPSLHIAVITADRVLADLKELYAVLRWGKPDQPADLTNCMTFISGPSKTADIEATLVHGAHGPKAVCLFVIAGAET